ncbi:hypothetical protein Knedl_CDS0022 [Pseudomonas phage Knedl]|nr:hypothetical protein Knedl_CDS0022 [Pseudomonas phage Knedl]
MQCWDGTNHGWHGSVCNSLPGVVPGNVGHPEPLTKPATVRAF